MAIKEKTEKSVTTVQSVETGPCEVVDRPDGGLSVTVQVDSTIAQRLRLRAQTMPLDRYLWENILKRAIADHVY